MLRQAHRPGVFIRACTGEHASPSSRDVESIGIALGFDFPVVARHSAGATPEGGATRCAKRLQVGSWVRRCDGSKTRACSRARVATSTTSWCLDMLHAAFVRSPHPHALIRSVDADAARRLPSVVAVFTGADIAKLTNPFIGLLPLPGLYNPVHYALAMDRVRLVGDPIAMVVATSRYAAEDAVELVRVEYEELEPIATIDHALDPRRPPIWPGARGNVMFEATDEYGDLDHAFATADRVITERFVQHRHANQPMETRGCVAEINRASNSLTYHAGTQSPHVLKWSLGLLTERQSTWRSIADLVRQRARLQRLAKSAIAYGREAKAQAASKPAPAPPPLMKPKATSRTAMLEPFVREPSRLAHMTRSFVGLLAKDPMTLPRVTAQDIGGAFGAKTLVSPEDVAVVAAAITMGRSIKWIEDRNEHLVVGAQARDERMDVDAAFTGDGTLLGLRARLAMDQGAYAGFPYRRGNVHADHQDDDARPVPFSCFPLRRDRHRVEQGDLRCLPWALGGGDMGARTTVRRCRA